MPLFDDSKTPAEKAADQICAVAEQTAALMQRGFRTGGQLLWANSHATPEEILAALGKRAAKVFQLSDLFVQVSNAAMGTNIQKVVPEGYTYTVNADGTISLTKQA